MTNEKMNKLGNIIAVIVLIICVLIIWCLVGGIDIVFWFFIIVEFIFGPACFVLYLREVKKGVFKDDSEEEE